MGEFRAKRSEAVSDVNRVGVSKGLLEEARVVGRELVTVRPSGRSYRVIMI